MGAKQGFRVLSVGVATGRFGYVFFVDGRLRDWRLSKKAAKSTELAKRQAEAWIEKLRPDVVVTEAVPERSTKSRKTRCLIDAIASAACEQGVLDVKVARVSAYKNKYEEAEALGRRFPEIAAWVPKKPRLWETEPRNTVYFEALALALEVVYPSDPDAGCEREQRGSQDGERQAGFAF